MCQVGDQRRGREHLGGRRERENCSHRDWIGERARTAALLGRRSGVVLVMETGGLGEGGG